MMDTLTPEALLGSINIELVKKFGINVLQEYKFLPINKDGDALKVAVVDLEHNSKKNDIITKVIITSKLKPVFISITQEVFNSVLVFLSKNIHNESGSDTAALVAKAMQAGPPKKRLGEQLIDEGLISKEQLARALAESKQTNTPIGSVLVRLGYISINQLRETLSKQQGYASVEAKDLKIDPSVIRMLPEDFIKDNRVVPVSSDGKIIVVGMVNPNDKTVLNDIIYLTGLKPFPLILTHIEFEKIICSFFESKKETEKIMEKISNEESAATEEESLWHQLQKELDDDSNIVAKLASSIIVEAIQRKASDVHIEPRTDKYIVRYRIDGILRQVLEVPTKVEKNLISRFKVMSRMNITENRRPQDGHLSIKHDGRSFDLRVNTLPVGNREKMVIRVLQPDLKVKKTDKRIQLVGATPEDIQKIDLMVTAPHGIILTTGPTGSGKTTTLYSVLNKVNNEHVNITTLEDPVEIQIEGINQVQVNPKADVTFASCMRAILRQDPDVIMIGEIRDIETLEAAIHASLTGHLVLSTLHTNSATATITRLIEMGAAPHLVASALMGVIAQRLVRKLCPQCKERYTPDPAELKLILQSDENIEMFMDNKIFKAKGCDVCENTGYVGRLGLYEIMPMNREVRKMITDERAAHEIEEIAIACGMKTLHRACIDGILNGETTTSEFLRILGAVNE